MKCPECNQAINYLAKQCRYCGYSFGDGIFNKLLLYFDLRKEFESLKSTKIKLDDGVKNIGSKIQKFEEIIASDITNAAEHSLKEKSIAPTPSSALSEVGAKLKMLPENDIIIEGHTDNIPVRAGGAFASNWELSLARSLSIVHYLVEVEKAR